MLVIERSPRTRRFLLTRSRADWTNTQLEVLGVELVIEKPWDDDQLRRDLERLDVGAN